VILHRAFVPLSYNGGIRGKSWGTRTLTYRGQISRERSRFHLVTHEKCRLQGNKVTGNAYNIIAPIPRTMLKAREFLLCRSDQPIPTASLKIVLGVVSRSSGVINILSHLDVSG